MKLKIITTNQNHDFKLDFWKKEKDDSDVKKGREGNSD